MVADLAGSKLGLLAAALGCALLLTRTGKSALERTGGDTDFTSAITQLPLAAAGQGCGHVSRRRVGAITQSPDTMRGSTTDPTLGE